MIPIFCVVLLTLLSAVLITLCITVILSSEETPPMTSTSDMPTMSTPIGTPQSTSQPPASDKTAPVTSTGHVTSSELSSTHPQPTTEKPVIDPPSTTPPPETTPAPITTKPPVTTAPPATTVPGGFKADLSAYEQYMDPTGELWDDVYLTLVNANRTLNANAEMEDPTLSKMQAFSESDDYNYTYKPSISLNETAMKALSAMFIEAKANGIRNLDVTSAYRDYAYQRSVFKSNCDRTFHWMCDDVGCSADWIAKESVCPVCQKKTTTTIPITQAEREANVATYSCAPGTSDHQTGLAIDIVQTSLPSEYLYLIEAFGETEAGKWLAENSWKFGFVLRFPPDKEESTGIIYEPWHFRFVGRTHASEMYEKNMCLEEYVEYLESLGYFD